ncbi:MAG TPA: pseudouridine synthase [Lachnospiraceae bacterium]|nr:pseudouridine synthase [Lachnospiraceae bacterium]
MYHYYQFHKPAGCVTALRDEHKPTIMQYLSDLDMTILRPVGRLDMDTEGLLILTDDGAYNQHMTHPDREIEKEYFFFALGTFTPEKQKILEQGAAIPAMKGRKMRPAYIEVSETMTLEHLPTNLMEKVQARTLKNRPDSPVFSGFITVTEGRKHEVKRLLKGIDCYCIYLKRIRMGEVRLFEDLALGEVREFVPGEKS